jgi:Phosphodiester glycosidase
VGALRRVRRLPVRLVAVVLPTALLTPAAPASAATACGTAGQLIRTPAISAHLASGVRVHGWNGTDAQGHAVRLTVAETDLTRVRLVAASARGYGDVAATTSLTGAVRTAVAGINGDYFSYDWSGDAVPDGPLVVGGRILRLPPGAHPAVGVDAGGRPFADSVRPTGTVRSSRGALPVGSVNAGLDPDQPDAVSAGRAVAVVTPWLGSARPSRQREVVVRRGVVLAVGRRLPFGPGKTYGSGSAGHGDVLLAANGRAGRVLAGLRRGARVAVSYGARTDAGARPVQAVGSGAAMLHAGRVLVGCSGVGRISRPRTLVAWNASHTRLWLVTVNGRGGGSPVSRYGASYRQIADAVRALGAADAVMLDGGGSTTMALRGPNGQVRRVDAPSGTPQRPVPDGLLLIPRR